jgi:predicted phosphate transport protein (TIGR00153 family)
MGLNSFLKAFLPKDKIFFSLFEEIGKNLTEMSEAFVKAMHEPDYNNRMAALNKLEDWEHKNDSLTHKVFLELGQNFITPFDREDIHYLATALDDVADYMYAGGKKIITYNVTEANDYMKQMSLIVKESVAHLTDAVSHLRDMKNIRAITEACVKVNSLENKADDLFDQGITSLFTNNLDAVEIIKLKDVYEDLEIITDKCEDATNIIESIIVKYA